MNKKLEEAIKLIKEASSKVEARESEYEDSVASILESANDLLRDLSFEQKMRTQMRRHG